MADKELGALIDRQLDPPICEPEPDILAMTHDGMKDAKAGLEKALTYIEVAFDAYRDAFEWHGWEGEAAESLEGMEMLELAKKIKELIEACPKQKQKQKRAAA